MRNFTAGGQRNYAFNGLSTTFRYDYLVRLHVEYTADVAPEAMQVPPSQHPPPSQSVPPQQPSFPQKKAPSKKTKAVRRGASGSLRLRPGR